MKREKVFLIDYKNRFVEPIRNWTKVLTIRENRKDGRLPEIGQILRKYTGLRTVSCKPIFDFKNGEIQPRCTGVWPIEIGYKQGDIYIKTKFFTEIMNYRYECLYSQLTDFTEFAVMDGWDSFDQMIMFFDLPLKANIIYWGEK